MSSDYAHLRVYLDVRRVNRRREFDVTRVVGYTRVSSDEQARSGLGLEGQRAAIEAEVARRGWTLVEVYEDAGYSGTLPAERRPGLRAALDAVESRTAGTLLIYKFDRLTRSLKVFATVVEQASKEGWNLVSLDLGVDLSTPPGQLVATNLTSTNVYERQVIAERTRAALAAKRARGERLGRRTTPDAVLQQIVEDRGAGHSCAAIARALNQAGVPTSRGGARWHARTVWGVLGSLAVPGLAVELRDRLVHEAPVVKLLPHVVQAVVDLRATSPSQVALELAPPPSTGDRRWDALVAGVAEQEARRAGVPVPEWTREPTRSLGRPWYPHASKAAAERLQVRSVTPPEFLRRNVFLDPEKIEPRKVT